MSPAPTRSRPDDVSLCVMPLFHVHGLVASTLATLVSGGTVVVPAKFNPLAFWRTGARISASPGIRRVPTIHQLLLARAARHERANTGPERCASSAPAARPCRREIMQQMENVFGVPVLEAYGMTEAAHQMASNPLPPQPRKAGSVGPATGTVRISIMDDEGQSSRRRRARRSGHPGAERLSRLREQSGGQCQRPFSTAGFAPATRAFSMRTATCFSPAGSRS